MELRETSHGITLAVEVKVRAGHTRVLGIKGDHLSVALAAAPVGGAANDALRRALADHFELSRSQVRILSGEKHRRKVVALSGISADDVSKRLQELGAVPGT